MVPVKAKLYLEPTNISKRSFLVLLSSHTSRVACRLPSIAEAPPGVVNVSARSGF